MRTATILVALLTGQLVSQDLEFPDGVDRITVEMLRHCTGTAWGLPLVEVVIEGRRELFLLDSGDGTITVDRELAEQLQLKQVGRTAAIGVGGPVRIAIYRGEQLAVGGAVLWDCHYTEGDLAFLGSYRGRKIRGGLGLPFLAQAVCTFDYQKGELVLQRPETFEPPARATAVDLIWSAGGLACKGRFGDSGRRQRFLIDTGSEGCLHLHAATIKRLGIAMGPEQGRPRMLFIGYGEGTETMQLASLPQLQLGDRVFTEISTFLGAPAEAFTIGANRLDAGTIGTSFLVPFRATLAAKQKKLYLEGGGRKPRWPIACGISIGARDDVIWIDSLFEGVQLCEPALTEELQLLAIDGEAPPAQVAAVFDLLSAKPERELTVIKGGERVVLRYRRPWPLPAVVPAAAGAQKR